MSCTWDSPDPLIGPVRRHTRSTPGASLPRPQSARRASPLASLPVSLIQADVKGENKTTAWSGVKRDQAVAAIVGRRVHASCRRRGCSGHLPNSPVLEK